MKKKSDKIYKCIIYANVKGLHDNIIYPYQSENTSKWMVNVDDGRRGKDEKRMKLMLRCISD